jgi:hypothetical protein
VEVQTAALHSTQILALQQANSSVQQAAAAMGALIAQTYAQQFTQTDSLRQVNFSVQTAAAAMSARVSLVESSLNGTTSTVTLHSTLIAALQMAHRSTVDAAFTLAAQLAALVQVQSTSNMSLSSTISSLTLRVSAVETQQAASNSTLSYLSSRISAVEQLQPSLPFTVLYSTLRDLRNVDGQSQLVRSVMQMQGWIGVLNRTIGGLAQQADSCNSPTSSCNLCFPVELTILGAGSVQLSPTGCQASYFVPGSTVTFSMSMPANVVFNGWSGDFPSNSSQITFIMPAAPVTVTASFTCLLSIPSNASFPITLARSINYQMWGGQIVK